MCQEDFDLPLEMFYSADKGDMGVDVVIMPPPPTPLPCFCGGGDVAGKTSLLDTIMSNKEPASRLVTAFKGFPPLLSEIDEVIGGICALKCRVSFF